MLSVPAPNKAPLLCSGPCHFGDRTLMQRPCQSLKSRRRWPFRAVAENLNSTRRRLGQECPSYLRSQRSHTEISDTLLFDVSIWQWLRTADSATYTDDCRENRGLETLYCGDDPNARLAKTFVGCLQLDFCNSICHSWPSPKIRIRRDDDSGKSAQATRDLSRDLRHPAFLRIHLAVATDRGFRDLHR